jgi:hypothetical protein
MKTIETKVYEFAELNDSAKDKARDWYRQGNDYNPAEDALASIKQLAEHFGGTMKDWQIDWHNNSHSYAKFAMPELELKEIASHLAALGTFNPDTLKGRGDCKLTGYCADEDAIDGFRKAFHGGERDLEKLMQSAFETWLKAAQADCEHQNSDAAVDESIIANGYTFTETGKRFG